MTRQPQHIRNSSSPSIPLKWMLSTSVLAFLGACGGGGTDTSATPPSAKAWQAPVLIETDNAGGVNAARIAMNPNGQAVAVWVQGDGTRANIWANHFNPATSAWASAQLIETDNIGNAYAPQVAVNASGNAIAVWQQSDGTRENIWANRYVGATGTWIGATLIETSNLGDATAAHLAFDTSGNAIAVWQQSDGTRNNIWANRYNATTGLWAMATLIETDNAGDAFTPRIAFGASGNAVAVWTQSDGTHNNGWANRYSGTAGTWGAAELIETDNAGSAAGANVAVDASDNALAVWDQRDGTRPNIWANRYSASSGTWGTAKLLETDNAGDAYNPSLAMDASGNAMTVWYQSDGTRYNIWTSRFSASTNTWVTPELLENDNAGNAYNASVVIDASGNALAVWDQNDGTRANVWASRYE
jgi:hypothetical protein